VKNMVAYRKYNWLLAISFSALPALSMGAVVGGSYPDVPASVVQTAVTASANQGNAQPATGNAPGGPAGGAPGAAQAAGGSGGGAPSGTGTPTAGGNASAVSSLLHPVDKNAAAAAIYAVPVPETNADVRGFIMDNSINAFNSYCACPYSKNHDGFECGVEAAYYKPGGYRIYCFPQDVRGQQNIFYRKSH
jgi:hypothetical protein